MASEIATLVTSSYSCPSRFAFASRRRLVNESIEQVGVISDDKIAKF